MKHKSMIICLTLVLFILMLMPGTAFGSLDNKGAEFLIGFLPNYTNQGNLQLHLTGDIATTVTVEYPVGTVQGTHAVTPGSVTVISIPVTAQQWTADTAASKLVRASAPDEFVAYMANIFPYSSDAALALPVDTMNTEYILSDYNGLYSSYPAEFVVFAAYDNTTVTINPTANINGHAAGTDFSVVLNAGEGYFNRTTGSTATLTGSIVSADRPVGVTNGVACTNIPDGYGACDHTFEVAQPVQSWGTRIGVANLPLRDTTFYRILASQDGTTITQDGSFLASLNRGDYYEVGLGGNHVFEGDKAIYVIQYMPGQGYPGGHGTGDPAQGNMIPFDQYLTDYTFSTVGGGQFARNFVTIIAQNADVGTLTLDGAPVPAASFSPVGTSGYSAAVKELAEGTHSTSSALPHGITVEGYNNYDSYIYPGGALFQFINPVGDSNAPIITLTTDPGPPPEANGTATDNRPSEDTNGNDLLDPGEDLNGDGLIDEDTGIFIVELDAGATNLVLTVDPFVPGDGTVNFTVSLSNPLLPGSGDVLVTDGAGNVSSEFVELIPILNEPPVADAGGPYNVNEGGSVGLTGSGNDPDTGDILTYAWDLDYNNTFETPGQNPTFSAALRDGPDSQIVVLQVCDDKGACATDNATVTILNVAPVASLANNGPINEGGSASISFSGASDPSAADNTAGLRYAFNCSGNSLAAATYAAGSTSDSTTCSFADDGSYTVSGKVMDKDDGATEYTTSVQVDNVAPIVSLLGDTTANEDDIKNYTFSTSDPGDELFSLVSQTCGATGTLINDTFNSSNGSGSFDCDFADDDPTGTPSDTSVVSVTVSDNDGGSDDDSINVTVSNLAPVITAFNVPAAPVEMGTVMSVDGTFTDVGALDTHTATVDWGDTSSSAAAVPGIAGPGTFDADHIYTVPGVYSVIVTLSDDDTGADSETYQYVVVFDPDGGFVTGGGWIMSPAGAYVDDPFAAGKANFGFVSKYKKGANVPTGNTQFQFKAGDLNFHSSSYDWLVVPGKTKAKYKGTGTINGAGSYGFMLTAQDFGKTGDTFRIKIWDKNDSDTLVYDNFAGPDDDKFEGLEIDGGNIVIHTRGK